MIFPYQCLIARRDSIEDSNKWTLFGASGSKLVAQTSNGAISVWSLQDEQVIEHEHDEPQEPPGKRIKLAPSKEQRPNFSSITFSSDGQYLVGVTGEDKCIRVFQVSSEGRLYQLSERCMSRRPSSITLTFDDSTILCADKFGDVYALPLLPSPEVEQFETPVANDQPGDRDFTPSATVLTVHSGRNRKTLEEQLKQKARGSLKTKEAMTFRHDLLLGHVSMLTDLAYTKVDKRGYIITADRDEHIRISRGLPQAHIIEGFCFGHGEFVSRLCLTPSGLLVSGGGDASLYTWDWQSCRLVEKLPLRDTVLQNLKARPELNASLRDDASFKVAVSGIWNVPSDDPKIEILVACEGLPALFAFKIGEIATSGSSIPLSGNALDVAFIQTSQSSWTTIVSIDNVHKPGSTTELRDDKNAPRLQHFSNQVDGCWREDANMENILAPFAEEGSQMDLETAHGEATNSNESGSRKALRDILYNVENLRKRPGAE